MSKLTGAGPILVIDDEVALLEACHEALSYHGYDVELHSNPQKGIAAAEQGDFQLALVDLKMPGTNGIEVLKALKGVDAELSVVVITGYPQISTAVEAVRVGAFDYLPKPFSPEQLLVVVQRALEQRRLSRENERLRRQLRQQKGFEGVIGQSPPMRRLMELAEKVADSDTTILVEGETGTGKELVARSLHAMSRRRDQAFLPINCGALPEPLLESELFGHERGAFTGAYQRKAGLLESAQGGTVFLDEITTLAMGTQAKLLRVLQERQVRRVGGQAQVDIDIRVIAATNESLEQAMAEGRFRQDLYYRLNVIALVLPPLRQRQDDIPLLVAHFVDALNQRHKKQVEGPTPDAMAALLDCDWPGNVRELENALERAHLLTDAGPITLAELPPKLGQDNAGLGRFRSKRYKVARRHFEREYISQLLESCGGNITKAAAQAGMHRTSFQRLIKKCGISVGQYRD